MRVANYLPVSTTVSRNTLIRVRGRKHVLRWASRGVLFTMMLMTFVHVTCFATTYSGVVHASSPGTLYSGSLFQNGDTYNADVYIDARTEVVITGKTINMGRNTTIHVSPTATLILCGTTITGTFTDIYGTNGWWNGIEVQGTPGNHQPTVANVKSGSYTTGVGSSYYNQGAIWMHDNSGTASVISYSKWGIYAGRMPIYGGASLAGGVVICENSNFTNNYASSIYFDDNIYVYPYMNESYVSGCAFSWDASVRTAGQGFIIAYNNVFSSSYPVTSTFSSNSFTVTGFTYNPGTMTPSQYGGGTCGIYASGCCYSAEGNDFENLYAGIYNNSTVWGQRLTGNRGNYDYYGIIENGSPLSYLNYNNFQLIGQYGFGYGDELTNATGIYVNGATNFSAQANFFQSSGAPGAVSNIYGMYIKNNGNYGNILNFNTAHEIPNGISAAGNNTGTLLKCNDLSNVYPQYCVAVTSGNIAKVQGNKNVPAGNQFSNQTYVSYEDFDRYSGTYLGASTIDYYYNPAGDQIPQYDNINTHSISGTISCGFLPYGYSPVASVISSINSDIAGLPAPGTGTTDQQNEYTEDLLQRQYYIGAAVRALMAFDTVSASPDTMQLASNIENAIDFVETQGDQVDSFLLINLYIAKQSYDDASSIISALSSAHGSDNEITNYCSFYSIYISGLENSFNSGWQSSYTGSLETIAATATMASASAQSLLQYISDKAVMMDTLDTAKTLTILYPPDFEYITGGGAMPELAGIPLSTKAAQLSINAWPDPVTDNLQIEVKNPSERDVNLHIIVIDNLGKTIIDQMASVRVNSDFSKQIDMSSLANGLYLLSVTDNQSVLHKQTIVKQ